MVQSLVFARAESSPCARRVAQRILQHPRVAWCDVPSAVVHAMVAAISYAWLPICIRSFLCSDARALRAPSKFLCRKRAAAAAARLVVGVAGAAAAAGCVCRDGPWIYCWRGRFPAFQSTCDQSCIQHDEMQCTNRTYLEAAGEGGEGLGLLLLMVRGWEASAKCWCDWFSWQGLIYHKPLNFCDV